MTLGVGYEDRGDLASLLSEVSDRRHVSSSQQAFDESPTYEVTKTMDPSGGANYSGGSSYTAGMPLTSSNAGLAGHDGSGFRNVNFGSMSYGEAMNWNPASMTQRIGALKAGAGRTFEGLDARLWTPGPSDPPKPGIVRFLYVSGCKNNRCAERYDELVPVLVRALQDLLADKGYPVKTTGYWDRQTLRAWFRATDEHKLYPEALMAQTKVKGDPYLENRVWINENALMALNRVDRRPMPQLFSSHPAPLGELGEASTMNAMWYYLAAAALAYIALKPKETRYGY